MDTPMQDIKSQRGLLYILVQNKQQGEAKLWSEWDNTKIRVH